MNKFSKLKTLGSAEISSFRDTITKGKKEYSSNENYLKVVPPAEKKKSKFLTYKLRLIPHPDILTAETPDELKSVINKSIFRHRYHGWTNDSGQYVTDGTCPSCLDPKAVNPIDLYTIKAYQALNKRKIVDKEAPERKALQKYLAKEKWHVNVLVLEDPTNPDNNGKVKILKMSKQVNDIVLDALENELFGPRIFDLSSDGCTLRLRIGWNSDGEKAYVTYANTMFEQGGSAIPGYSTDEEFELLYKDHYIDLLQGYTPKTKEELQEFVKVNIVGDAGNVEETPKSSNSNSRNSANTARSNSVNETVHDEVDGEDELDMSSLDKMLES